MKRIRLTVLSGLLVLGLTAVGFAGTADFFITATVPTAVDVGFTTSQVDPDTSVFTLIGTGDQTMDFGTMTFDEGTGTFLPPHIYAVDVGPVDVAGDPAAGLVGTVTVGFAEDPHPNGTGKGLGLKSTLTYVEVTGAPGAQTETVFNRKLLNNVVSALPADFNAGFLRLYVGIYTGEVFTTFPVSTDGEPFLTTDAPGPYTGTLTLSATLL